MNIITEIRGRVDRLSACAELDVEASELPDRATALSDDSLLQMMSDLAAVANDAARLQSVLAGVAAHRSRREAGQAGLAAVRGHATTAALIQSITGGTRADATRQVRIGTSLVDPGAAGELAAGDTVAAAGGAFPRSAWHEPLRRALLDGRLTPPQQDAIQVGLGEPPATAHGGHGASAVDEAWSLAAEGLIEEAGAMPVEELAKRARVVRDMLDPVGAEERFGRRYESRSFRMWVDGEGQHRARIAFDDEMALWVRSMLDAALRPRRGGPRFVTQDDRAAADGLVTDPRSNEQLEYDLLTDVLKAGSLASHEDVFGARQPGVRMLVVDDIAGPRDALGRLLVIGHAEDGGDALTGSVIDRARCMHGSTTVTVDRLGNPLDVGREQRLYTPRQRVALAARDGGCLWPGCAKPASYCEAHHCDHFVEHEGRTDIDRGVLLCRFHHMLLHNQGWRITRSGRGPFVLHPPPGHGSAIVLSSKAVWRWAWDPPPPPERADWRSGAARSDGGASR